MLPDRDLAGRHDNQISNMAPADRRVVDGTQGLRLERELGTKRPIKHLRIFLGPGIAYELWNDYYQLVLPDSMHVYVRLRRLHVSLATLLTRAGPVAVASRMPNSASRL